MFTLSVQTAKITLKNEVLTENLKRCLCQHGSIGYIDWRWNVFQSVKHIAYIENKGHKDLMMWLIISKYQRWFNFDIKYTTNPSQMHWLRDQWGIAVKSTHETAMWLVFKVILGNRFDPWLAWLKQIVTLPNKRLIMPPTCNDNNKSCHKYTFSNIHEGLWFVFHGWPYFV